VSDKAIGNLFVLLNHVLVLHCNLVVFFNGYFRPVSDLVAPGATADGPWQLGSRTLKHAFLVTSKIWNPFYSV